MSNPQPAPVSPAEQIVRAIAQKGQYTHNILTLVLRGVARKEGIEAANALVQRFSLAKLFRIFPQPTTTKEDR